MKANYLFQCETDEEHINAHRAVVDQLRQLNELAITLNSDSQALHEIAQITAELYGVDGGTDDIGAAADIILIEPEKLAH
jgi:hypothetical protein